MTSRGSNIWRLGVEALFPRFCVRCEKEGSLLCRSCDEAWRPSFSVTNGVWHFLTYADPVARQLITAWKYQFDTSAWEILQRRLQPLLTQVHLHAAVHGAEAITYVPLSRTRRCERGFDQAEAIAAWLSGGVHLPKVRLLNRRHRLGHQAERSTLDRSEAMKVSPFSVAREAERALPKTLLLVDDVWTTGATAESAIRVLRGRGVEKVIPVVLAKG